MVGYVEYTKGYKIFYPSTQNIFRERSVQFKEEVIPYFELAPGECSSPQYQDDVSDDSIYDIYDIHDSYMSEYDVSEHESPSIPKWEKKTIEISRDLASNPLDPKKTRSQFQSAYFENELSLDENL